MNADKLKDPWCSITSSSEKKAVSTCRIRQWKNGICRNIFTIHQWWFHWKDRKRCCRLSCLQMVDQGATSPYWHWCQGRIYHEEVCPGIRMKRNSALPLMMTWDQTAQSKRPKRIWSQNKKIKRFNDYLHQGCPGWQVKCLWQVHKTEKSSAGFSTEGIS